MKDLFLYFSAFIPMYVLILIKFVFERLNGNITFNVINTLIFILLSVMVILGIIGLIWTIKLCPDKSEEVVILTQRNITDEHFFNYVSLFVLFALSFELTKVCMFVVSGVIITIIGIVYITNKMFYIKSDKNRQTHSAKLFFKGTPELNTSYKLKLKNKNFTFVDKK